MVVLKKIFALLFIVLTLFGCSKSTKKILPEKKKLPSKLGNLKLSKQIGGKEALYSLEKLHRGLSQKPKEALIGFYGDYYPKMVIWVSFSKNEKSARLLIGQMSKQRLAKGGFSNFNWKKYENIKVLTMDGMGQKHYLFQKGTAAIWLASEKKYASSAITQLINYIKERNW